jgi:4-diphosphocytidyl-2-C-methyl-D-erythritol kinase
MPLTVTAPAKINLDLRVLQRRPDGFHELRTLFQEIALHDTVTAEASRGRFAIRGDAAAMPLDRSNLAWRAAEALWRASGRTGPMPGARLTIEKRIPPRAGLGGGSSDAAATLVALDRLWRLRLGSLALLRIARVLGADVPFFLVGGTVLGLGRGDDLHPLVDLPAWPVVLVLPPVGVDTASAYRWLAARRSRAGSSGGPMPLASQAAVGPGPGWVNDLEEDVVERHPEIGAARQALLEAGAWHARMSGSGSAVFGLYRSAPAARRAASALESAGWPVVVTRTAPRRAVSRRRLADLWPG